MFLWSSLIISQNKIELIPNGGFEFNSKIPFESNQLNFCQSWYSPINSSDYFHDNSPSNSVVNTKNNLGGSIVPYEGNACAGFSVFYHDYGYSEYVEVKLLDTLEAGREYILSFYLSFAPNSTYKHHKRISYSFLDTSSIDKGKFRDMSNKYCSKKGRCMLDVSNNVNIKFDSLYKKEDDIYKWVKIESSYIANGNETYLTIGVFKNSLSKSFHFYIKHLCKKNNPQSLMVANYYFIDNVSLLMCE